MFFKHLAKIGNVCESLVRNGYEIYINAAREVHFFYDSDFDHNQGIFDSDGELISAFLNGRAVTAYYSMSVEKVSAPFPPVVPISTTVAEPVAEPVAECVVDSTFVVTDTLTPATSAFKPSLTYCDTPPAQSPDFLETLTGPNNEYVVYAKESNTFHIHWKVSRPVAKEVWRRDRESIRQWLGADILNTVSWEEPSAKADKAPKPKWKEISAEQTKVRTVVRQLVAFGKPVADLAQLDDGTYHVYFHIPQKGAKQIYPNIKAEFAGYEVASVSFEEHLTRKDEWVEQFHCVDPIATENDSVAVSNKELYRFLTQRIDSLIQDDTFCHNGHCWTLKDSDLSLSTLAQLAFRVPFFSVDAQESASRIAHTLLNGKTVILTD